MLDPKTAAQLVQMASSYESRVSLRMDEKTANAKSIMGIISMSLESGRDLTITADGPDEVKAVSELSHFLGNLNEIG